MLKPGVIPTESTHGRHVWTVEQRRIEIRGKEEIQELLLWDLAGQPGYRLIHQLHLDQVSVALVVFDARSETDPFAGVRHWDRALRQAQYLQGANAPRLKKFLVSARTDRGGTGVSRARLDEFARQFEFDRYFETSAKEGLNIQELGIAIRESIEWESMPKVSSSKLFQDTKDFLVAAKQSGHVLSAIADLYRTLLASWASRSDRVPDVAEFDACIARLQSANLIRRLSFGNLILLQPELLDSYASALVNAAKDEPDGLELSL